MADSMRVGDNRRKVRRSMACDNTQPKLSLVASIPKHCSKAIQRVVNVDQNQSILGMDTVSEIGQFLLKLAVLEAVRRISNVYCPVLWRSLQALQCFCLPPLKWIQKWSLFKGFIKCMQSLSRPLLLLSVATSLSSWSSDAEGTQGSSESSDVSEPRTDPQSNSVANRTSDSSGVTRSQPSEDWMLQLYAELEKEGIALPERITEHDLRTFYHVAKGDFTSFLSSVKRTITWRQNFRFMTVQELEDWSEMVFWHGVDVKQHPCLIIRVQSACFGKLPEERSRLPEVIVSQIEFGIIHLVRAEDPLVTVLMDCEGLSPFGFPINMMRSCAILLQDHYPNRLAALYVVRLPPIARVIAQTLFQVLRPGTRRKLRILGEDYQKVLSEHLQALPTFLGGDCTCPKCSKLIGGGKTNVVVPIEYVDKNAPSSLSTYSADDFEAVKCDKVLKSITIGLILLLLLIVFGVHFHSLEGIQLYRRG